MKSTSMLSLVTVAALALTSAAYAAGQGGAGRGGVNASGTQLRIHTPGTGLTAPVPVVVPAAP
jgi:hypothetical protein